MVGALVGGAVLSAFLQVAFDRAASREVLDYLNGRKLIDRLVQKLKLELMSAGAVLNDAEEKQITDPAVKKWLDELKDAVYVADDLLDEIAYEALRCKLEAETTNTSKVIGFLSTFVNSFDKRIQSELENILEQLEFITKRKDVLRLEKVAVAEVSSRLLITSRPEDYGVFGRDMPEWQEWFLVEVLSFKDMPEWQEWFLFEGKHEDEGGVFSTLKKLCIIECPKLSSGLPSQLPSLIKLKIIECQQLVASIPGAPSLNTLQLSDYDKVSLKELPPKLELLEIRGGCIFLQSIVELMTCLAIQGSGLPTTLKLLQIQGTFQITTGHYYPSLETLCISDGSDSLWSFPLESYPKLKSLIAFESKTLESISASGESYRDLSSLTYLSISFSPNFVSLFSGGISAPNLTSIWISHCQKLKSLPKNMHTLLPSLEHLDVNMCTQLELFPGGCFPINLVTLHVGHCDKLFSGGIASSCKEVESFPYEALLPPTLTDICIACFPNLKSLMGLPASLSTLILYRCPLLKQRCEIEKGKNGRKLLRSPP